MSECGGQANKKVDEINIEQNERNKPQQNTVSL